MNPNSERGYALLTVVLATGILLVAGAVTIQMSRTELHSSAVRAADVKAFYVAEAGIQRAVAELDLNQVAARASTTYTIPFLTEPFGEGSYTVSVEQDPLYPTDPLRKIATSTASVDGAAATLRARIFINPADPCDSTIMTSYGGNGRLLVSVNSSLFRSAVCPTCSDFNLFNGDIHSNGHLSLEVNVGVGVDATGTLSAVGNVVEAGTGISILSTMAAEAEYGGAFVPSPTHVDPAIGLHFANGAGQHGVQTTVAARALPRINHDAIQREPGTIVVNADNVPTGSWDSASDTWTLATFTLPMTARYYVEGNVNIADLSLDGGSTGMIVARGWIVVDALTLVASSLFSGSVQQLALIAGDDVVIGRPLVTATPYQLEPEASALASASTGLITGVAAVAHRNEFLVYSEKGMAWAKFATATAFSENRTCVLAGGDTTLAYGANVVAGIAPLY